MLKLLVVQNIALSASVELSLGPGLNVLTGETGAGKSLVVDALGLLLGDRAGPELIRTGEEAASVQAVFAADAAGPRLEAHGLPIENDEVIVRRDLQASGRSRASINGTLVPVSLLRSVGETLAVIYGQHEHRALLDPESHGALLDRFAGLSTAANEVGRLYHEMRSTEKELEQLRAGEQGAAQRRELLLFQLAEIDRAEVEAGEDERLAAERKVQANAERLANLAREAYGALFEDEGSVLERLSVVYRRVEDLAAIDPRFTDHAQARAGVVAALNDLSLALRDYRETLTVDPARLDAIEARLALIERLKKRHGDGLDAVLDFARDAREELGRFASPGETRAALENKRANLRDRYLSMARELSIKRRQAAFGLEERIRVELDEVAMEGTRFAVDFGPPAGEDDEIRWTARGLEQPQFLLSANVGEDLRPLSRIASGGELSRILLALRTVDPKGDGGATAVFDEVDSGIGGRVAEVVGRKLKAISRTTQVLCVTHLASIASQADQHFAVRKHVTGGRTISDVQELGAAERVTEIARMIGGESISDVTRKHAKEMIEGSRKAKKK